jgi:hypothetical protein
METFSAKLDFYLNIPMAWLLNVAEEEEEEQVE